MLLARTLWIVLIHAHFSASPTTKELESPRKMIQDQILSVARNKCRLPTIMKRFTQVIQSLAPASVTIIMNPKPKQLKLFVSEKKYLQERNTDNFWGDRHMTLSFGKAIFMRIYIHIFQSNNL